MTTWQACYIHSETQPWKLLHCGFGVYPQLCVLDEGVGTKWEFPPIELALNLVREMVVCIHNSCATTATMRTSFLEYWTCNMHVLSSNSNTGDFSLPAGCTAPSSTKKSNQRGGRFSLSPGFQGCLLLPSWSEFSIRQIKEKTPRLSDLFS